MSDEDREKRRLFGMSVADVVVLILSIAVILAVLASLLAD